MSLASAVLSPTWPTLMVCAWLGALVIVAFVVRSIVTTAINKADARDVPRILEALVRLLPRVIRNLVMPLLPLLPADPPVAPLDGAGQAEAPTTTNEAQI